MENNTNATLNSQITPAVLTNKVKEFKIIARNALRMELINPILAEINRLERETKTVNDIITAQNKRIAIAKYKITRLERLDADHPDFDNLKKAQEENIKFAEKEIETLNKENETYAKRITEEKETLTKIETGEIKVCAERLEDMVNTLIIQDAKKQINS